MRYRVAQRVEQDIKQYKTIIYHQLPCWVSEDDLKNKLEKFLAKHLGKTFWKVKIEPF